MNYLALNLAAEIAHGKKSSAQARAQLTRAAQAFTAGQSVEGATALTFAAADQRSADPDKASIR